MKVMSRRKAREKLFSVLYQVNVMHSSAVDVIEIMNMSEDDEKLFFHDDDKQFIVNYAKEIITRQDEIVDVIKTAMTNWNYDRLGVVEQAILLIAFYELIQGELNQNIIVNEAVELAKHYGDDKTPKFINGVLANHINK
jgi:N utilization substance protein B